MRAARGGATIDTLRLLRKLVSQNRPVLSSNGTDLKLALRRGGMDLWIRCSHPNVLTEMRSMGASAWRPLQAMF